MTTYGLKGVAIVTGAASGIGRECAESFVDEGCSGVVFADINLDQAQQALKETAAALSLKQPDSRTLALQVDVSDESSVGSMVAKTVEAFGRVDYCIHAAGVGSPQPSPVLELTNADFDRTYNVNVRGTLNMVRAVGRQMAGQAPLVESTRRGEKLSQGSIVALASCHSVTAARNLTPYITSKHAVLGVTRTAAMDLAQHGVRVNAVCPGYVDTPMIAEATGGVPKFGHYIETMVPLGRMATPREVSEVALFLASSRASFVTGAAWVIDGGLTVGFPDFSAM